MKAAVVRAFGEPLVIEERPDPTVYKEGAYPLKPGDWGGSQVLDLARPRAGSSRPPFPRSATTPSSTTTCVTPKPGPWAWWR
ncbi:hypothetical protein [Streptomyces sp. NBC_01320]|uniref:hypothetical protein n=1 Tax=Streptomyces sp. NBC_01320 TaxID=2903824 RepID=UPI002E1018A3|nr:hypothetical protein OG395_11635 [Streptomyces sp. NBC_01320]